MIKVLVVDDHARMRKSVRMLLERSGEVTVIGEAEEGKSALEQIELLAPDLVILDISMPGMNGLEVLQAINLQKQPPQVIMLSMNDSSDLIKRALRSGAADFVSKSEASARLLPAVRRAALNNEKPDASDNSRFTGLAAILALL